MLDNKKEMSIKEVILITILIVSFGFLGGALWGLMGAAIGGAIGGLISNYVIKFIKNAKK